jgi:anaerobic sulfite reductase subunit B
VGAPDPMLPVPYRVASRHTAGPDVATLALHPVEPDDALPPPQPGQFMMIWAFGVGEIPISVSGIGPDGSIEITVKDVGPVSAAIVGAGPTEVLGVRGPYGTAWPIDDVTGSHVVVVAGGLGLAPLRMAIGELVAGLRTPSGPRAVTVLLGARDPAQLLFVDEYEAWRADGAEVMATVDAAGRGWSGAVGTATSLVERHEVAGDLALVCGPELMMLSAARALVHEGMAADRVHVSLERNMHCGVAKCGRCQLGPLLLCRDGAVARWDHVSGLMAVRGR